MLGCGNGELDWENQVRPLMEKYLSRLPIDIYVYLYRNDPFEVEQRNIEEIKKWLRSGKTFKDVWRENAKQRYFKINGARHKTT